MEENTTKKSFFGLVSDHLPQIIPICTSIMSLIWIFLGLSKYGFWDEYKGPKTGFFPTIIAFVMLAISIFALVTSKNSAKPEFDRENWMAALGMLSMVLMSYIVGMELSILIFMILWLRVYEKCTWKVTAITTAVVMFIVIGAFRLWLGIQFPMGLFSLILG
ncbi:MAG: tripartite tricarboxylate transporter TctB family protein [Sphaerochaetaceae bacterium]|nr:tripartite tricarboxylate transporter TctB family protein [Sphaerochaetaceae bacterium]